jgi:ubiquinone/menaquinone biosynthesis C-methylase UbiE
MTDTDKLFAGSIPELYERFLVPLIFQPYADDLSRRIASLGPAEILETAAGTGVVTRALVAVLPPDARITATDLNQPMLDRAKAQMPASANVIWQQADALALPVQDGSFDVVACQFGAMFFPDKIRAYGEARRALRAGGHFVFSVWDRIAENEFADVVTQALADLFPDDPPQFLARTPHGYHDVERIRDDLKTAGFSDVTIDPVDHVSRAQSSRDPAIAYCQGTPLRNEIEARDISRLQEATDRAADALTKRFGAGPIEGRIRAFVMTARR